MVQLSTLFIGLVAVATSTHAAPIVLNKRIAQVIADSTTKWSAACTAAGGGQQCNPLSITAFSTLLAAPGPCEQQDAADQMVNLAKSLGSSELLALSQIFAQQPRNSPNSVATPYCQKAPQNAELNGLFQCQFVGSNQKLFAGGAALGQAGTIPFGRTAVLNPLGSCPANPSGPIADGTQLTDITSSPGVPDSSSGSSAPAATTKAKSTAATVTTQSAAATSAVTATAAPPTATTAATTASTGFALSNGQAAQALNQKFATLTASSACTEGENACVNGGFAQCVGGKFAITACAAPAVCVALPLVNSAGTSITCDTTADALARIAETGAIGGLTGDSAASAPAASSASAVDSAAPATATPSPQVDTAAASSSSSFALSNGQAAQALNKKFATLSASSACTAGENACINGGFAQCVGGSFVVTPCAASLQCVALPLVNSAGTSITCDTTADALTRIGNTGATGGLTGA
ncbi:hypothetical protein HYPSUDRAFT_137556 [Hypholoma sublateritium FD-334 SS-4]|uniref:Carbohydrate-binding module family 19 domain-containing protein n=1 Tax=Hypholoma sublateritium (strain FD-334 SS-4) TaxID=945553 RepID=A0A0D2NXY9_HYPSF|nr:hypothetical protein HYPSUDRAFT_137556 [Hypholoma sublateritium FD-334 SS-4]